jgi:hypothetical protein
MPPQGVSALGWSSAAMSTGTSIVCIHHPLSDYKRDGPRGGVFRNTLLQRNELCHRYLFPEYGLRDRLTRQKHSLAPSHQVDRNYFLIYTLLPLHPYMEATSFQRNSGDCLCVLGQVSLLPS